MSDTEFEPAWERHKLPILLAGGLALYGAARFDATRPVAGVLLTYGFPLVALFMGSSPFRESALAGAAFAVGGVAALSAELAIGHAAAPSIAVFSLVPRLVLTLVSVLALLGAGIVQAAGANRGVRSTFAGWIGIVTMLALYLPAHPRAGRDQMDAFIAALLVSLFVGGGAGLLVGALAGRVLRRPASEKAAPKPGSSPD